MWERAELKSRSKLVMKRNYWNMFIVSAIVMVLSGGLSINTDNLTFFYGNAFFVGLIGVLLGVFVVNPLTCGEARFYLLNLDENQKLDELFYFFKHDYANVVKIMFIKNVRIFLWALLFVIPGVIKSYEYGMIPYILAEDSSISAEDAFLRTRELTNNQKLNIFVLDLSFVGWYLLGSFLIIGTLFVAPYYQGTHVELYNELKLINCKEEF